MSLCPMVACVRRSARREEADAAVDARSSRIELKTDAASIFSSDKRRLHDRSAAITI